jgi:predicted GNAT family acetyltransferase
MENEVKDNTKLNRFELQVDGHMAFADYQLKDGTIVFTHTESPPALAGKGVASALITGALRQVRARGLKVVSRCSFVTAFFKRHPEYAGLLQR